MDIRERVAAKITRPNCEACGENHWEPGEDDFVLLRRREDNTIDLRTGITVVAMSCANCGYLRLFNANTL